MSYLKHTLGLAAIGTLCLSCQSNFYQIDGQASNCQDGDTICLAYDNEPDRYFAFAIVSNGRFTFTGETTSTNLCRIYPIHKSNNGVSLFLEPDKLTVELSQKNALNRVSGSKINNQWQLLNDSIRILGERIVRIVQEPVSDSISQKERVITIDSLHRRMLDCIDNTAQRNKDNALGIYIRENYKKPEFK